MCCLLGVRCVCVCPFCVRCVTRGLTALALASTLSLRERPRFAPRPLLQPLCAQDQDPEPLALPWPVWELRSRQQEVSAPDSRTSWACCTPYRPMPETAPNTLAGCILAGSAQYPRGQGPPEKTPAPKHQSHQWHNEESPLGATNDFPACAPG